MLFALLQLFFYDIYYMYTCVCVSSTCRKKEQPFLYYFWLFYVTYNMMTLNCVFLNDQRIDLVWKRKEWYTKKKGFILFDFWSLYAILYYKCVHERIKRHAYCSKCLFFILMVLFGYYYYTFLGTLKNIFLLSVFWHFFVLYFFCVLFIFTFLFYFLFFCCIWKIYDSFIFSFRCLYRQTSSWFERRIHVSPLNFDSIYIIPTRQIKEDFLLSHWTNRIIYCVSFIYRNIYVLRNILCFLFIYILIRFKT